MNAWRYSRGGTPTTRRKAAQRLGFTLDDVAELLEAGQHRHRRRPASGLRMRAAAKLLEVEAKMADLEVIRNTLRAALDAGCEDLMTCAGSDCCPLPFIELASLTQPRA